MPFFTIDLVLNHGWLWGVPLDYLIKLCTLKYASKMSSQRRRKKKKIRQRSEGKFGEMKCCLMYFDSVDISRFARQISSRLQIHLEECMTCTKKVSLKHKLLASHFLDSCLLTPFFWVYLHCNSLYFSHAWGPPLVLGEQAGIWQHLQVLVMKAL